MHKLLSGWFMFLEYVRNLMAKFFCLPILCNIFILFVSRTELRRALRRGALDAYCADMPDCQCPDQIPSVQCHGISERSLAEIDQDGFAFAVDPLDKAFFERRQRRQPRWRYRIEIVLHNRMIVVQKRLLPYPPWSSSLLERLWCCLGMRFYLEAAALLRLRGVPGIPTIRAIDRATRSIYMDYIAGVNLRHVIAQTGVVVHNLDVREHPMLGQLSWPERVEREFELFWSVFGGRYNERIEELILAVNRQGVAIMDPHASNFVLGAITHSLYLVDFECVWLRSLPGWQQCLQEQNRLLHHRFHLRIRTEQ